MLIPRPLIFTNMLRISLSEFWILAMIKKSIGYLKIIQKNQSKKYFCIHVVYTPNQEIYGCFFVNNIVFGAGQD